MNLWNKKLTHARFITFLLFCTIVSSSFAENLPRCSYEGGDSCRFQIDKTGKSPLRVKLPEGERVQIVVTEEEISGEDSSIEYWGVPEKVKEKSYFSIKIESLTLDGKGIPLPASSISGLAQANTLSIYGYSDWFNIEIRGGDASTSYLATLHFVNNRLVWRRVKHGEFPNVVWETTTYSTF